MQKKLLSILLALWAGTSFATPNASAAVSKNAHETKHSRKHSKHVKHVAHKKKSPNYMYGKATYYGGSDGFEGKKMANGRRFNSSNISIAAHPTLPLGTKLSVTDLATNRTIYVEITDRMPRRDKVIDLSKGGAKVLGMHRNGTATVQLAIISDDEYQAKKNTIEIEDGDDGHPH